MNTVTVVDRADYLARLRTRLAEATRDEERARIEAERAERDIIGAETAKLAEASRHALTKAKAWRVYVAAELRREEQRGVL